MRLKRKHRVHLSQINLQGLGNKELSLSVIERYINHLLDVVQDQAVVLPERDPSQDPEDGELLFYDSKLYLAIGGHYYQVYPATGTTIILGEEDEEEDEEVTCNFPFGADEVSWAGVSLDPATGNQAVIAGSAGQQIALVYLEVSNPDADEDTEVYFHFSSDGSGTKLFRKAVPKGGGVVVQNFVGAQPLGAAGIGLYATTSGSATADLYVTAGYVLLDV